MAASRAVLVATLLVALASAISPASRRRSEVFSAIPTVSHGDSVLLEVAVDEPKQCAADFYCPIHQASCCEGGRYCCPIGSTCVGENKCANGLMQNALAIAKRKMELEGQKTLKLEASRKNSAEKAIKRRQELKAKKGTKKKIGKVQDYANKLKEELKKLKEEKANQTALVKQLHEKLARTKAKVKAADDQKSAEQQAKLQKIAERVANASQAAAISANAASGLSKARWCQCSDVNQTGAKLNSLRTCPDDSLLVGWQRGTSENISSITALRCCKACGADLTNSSKPAEYVVKHKKCARVEWKSFTQRGTSKCPKGTYVKGLFQGACDTINCIDGALCCELEPKPTASPKFRQLFAPEGNAAVFQAGYAPPALAGQDPFLVPPATPAATSPAQCQLLRWTTEAASAGWKLISKNRFLRGLYRTDGHFLRDITKTYQCQVSIANK